MEQNVTEKKNGSVKPVTCHVKMDQVVFLQQLKAKHSSTALGGLGRLSASLFLFHLMKLLAKA